MRNIPMLKVLGFLLPILAAAQFVFADTAADMKKAQKLYKGGKFGQAEKNYLNVINKADPAIPEDLDRAFRAQKKLPLVYLVTAQQPKAQAAVQQLLTRHSEAERLPHAVHEIVEKAKEHNRTLQAGQVYQDILAAQPQHPQALWLKMGVAIANAHLNDDQAADSALQNIIAQHANDERAVEALGQTAWAYRKLEKHEKARTVYLYVVDNLPKTDRTIFSKRGVVLCSIAIGDEAAAQAALQELLADFAEDKYMSEVVANIAGSYSKQSQPEKARDLHQYVVDNFPDSKEAIRSQRDIILCTLELGEQEAAGAATEELLQKYAGHKNLSNAVWNVAQRYRDKQDRQRAQALCQYLVNQHADAEVSIWAQKALLYDSIADNNAAATEAGIQQLLSRFSSNRLLPEVAYWVAQKLNQQNPARAVELSEYVARTHPNDEFALYSKVNSGVVQIFQDNDEGAEAIFSRVLSEYSQDPRLPRAIHLMAEGYWYAAFKEPRNGRELSERAKACFRRAMAKWESIMTRFPDAGTTPEACYLAGQCSYRLGHYEKAIEYYQRTADNWPNYQRAWLAQAGVAKMYKFMILYGLRPPLEAEAAMKMAYEKLIATFPNSPAAQPAHRWLERYAVASKGGEK